MPELPEVESLRRFLGESCLGKTIARVEPVSFASLKTYAPPLTALAGLEVEQVARARQVPLPGGRRSVADLAPGPGRLADVAKATAGNPGPAGQGGRWRCGWLSRTAPAST